MKSKFKVGDRVWMAIQTIAGAETVRSYKVRAINHSSGSPHYIISDGSQVPEKLAHRTRREALESMAREVVRNLIKDVFPMLSKTTILEIVGEEIDKKVVLSVMHS